MSNQRYSTSIPTVAIGTSLATTGVIGYGSFASGHVHIPYATASLTWHSCATEDGTFLPISNTGGTAIVSLTAINESVPIPTECSGCMYLKAVGASAGTVSITLKD